MKTNHKNKKKSLTFGDFIMAIYDVCGQRRAKNIVRDAVNAHLVVFRAQQHYLIS